MPSEFRSMVLSVSFTMKFPIYGVGWMLILGIYTRSITRQKFYVTLAAKITNSDIRKLQRFQTFERNILQHMFLAMVLDKNI